MLIADEVNFSHASSQMLPVDIINSETVQVQFSEDRARMWICVGGVCVLRIKMRGAKQIPVEGLKRSQP